jgi:hypothetical protein
MLALESTKDIYLINIKMSKADFCIKEAKDNADIRSF